MYGAKLNSRVLAAAAIVTVMVLAGALTALDIRPASSQAVVLEARRTKGEVPIEDPYAPAWGEAVPIEVSLTEQNVTPPKGGRAGTMTARALYDDQKLYIELEWADDTPDTANNAIALFPDAVAVEFPATAGVQVPSFCMGDPTSRVNIWQWKASWQADLVNGFQDVQQANPDMAVDDYPMADDPEFYPAAFLGNDVADPERATAAANLVASQFGTLTQDADQRSVEAWGIWQDGRWRVILQRDLRGASGLPSFGIEQPTNIAFAAWDGARQDRNGQKSVGQFVELRLLGPEPSEARWPLVVLALAGAFIFVLGGAFALDRMSRRAAT